MAAGATAASSAPKISVTRLRLATISAAQQAVRGTICSISGQLDEVMSAARTSTISDSVNQARGVTRIWARDKCRNSCASLFTVAPSGRYSAQAISTAMAMTTGRSIQRAP